MFFSFVLGALVMLVVGMLAPTIFTKMADTLRSLWDKVTQKNDDSSVK